MKYKLILFLIIIFSYCTQYVLCQEEGSEQTESEINMLDSLSNIYYQQWINDSTYVDSLANALYIPKIVYNDDSTEMYYLEKFYNGYPVYNGTDNLNASKTISTNKVWPNGGANLSLTGNGITIGLWDESSPRTSHREFILSGNSRITIDNSIFNQQLSHSTHVSGTLISKGQDGDSKGMAYEASLRAYDMNNQRITKLNGAIALNIREVQAKLLQKLEELTLYNIELKKEIELLKKEIKNNN